MSRIFSASLALVVAGLFAAPAGAQSLELGVWGGLSRTNEITTEIAICVLDTCRSSATHPHFWRRALAAGVMLRQERTERVGLRAEAALAPKGYGPGDHRTDWGVASQYLEFPLLAEARLLRLGAASLHLSTGVAPAVLLSCGASGTTAAGFVVADCAEQDPITQESYGPTRPYDLGWVIAPGLRLPVAYGSLMLELRHTPGLVDIRPDSYGHTANRATAVTLGSSWRVR